MSVEEREVTPEEAQVILQADKAETADSPSVNEDEAARAEHGKDEAWIICVQCRRDLVVVKPRSAARKFREFYSICSSCAAKGAAKRGLTL